MESFRTESVQVASVVVRRGRDGELRVADIAAETQIAAQIACAAVG